jgi:HAD superfamily hydrolase (TIGR01509 family)
MDRRALVLDFDGVIADTEPLHLRAFQEVLGEAGFTLTADAYAERYLGFDDEGAFRAVAADQGRPLSDAVVATFVRRKSSLLDAALETHDVLFPGAAEAIRTLSAALPLAIASGALRREIVAVLERAGLLGCFQVIIAAGDTAAGKPAPDPYVKAVGILDLPASRAAAVEDSHWGLESARAAGLRTVAVTTSYPAASFPEADLVVPDLASLTLERLGESALLDG